jgi:hypothetical protein
MLKISSQRLLINFTSSYVLKQDFFYPNILATHSWLLLNIWNSKLIITFKIKSYLKGIFASLMILTNNPFKSSLQYLQPTFLIRHFYAFCSLCTWSFKKIYPSQFLILCNKNDDFILLFITFLSCKFSLNSVFKALMKICSFTFHWGRYTELIMFGKFLKSIRKTFR